MKARMVVELEYNQKIMHGLDKEGISWFYNEILHSTKGLLLLHSNVVGDTLGNIKVLSIEKPYNQAFKQMAKNATA